MPAAVVARELLLAMAVRMTQQRWLVSPGTGLARRPVKTPSFLAVLAVLWIAVPELLAPAAAVARELLLASRPGVGLSRRLAVLAVLWVAVPELLAPPAAAAIPVRMMQHRRPVSPGTGLARRPVKRRSFLAVLAVLWVTVPAPPPQPRRWMLLHPTLAAQHFAVGVQLPQAAAAEEVVAVVASQILLAIASLLAVLAVL